MDHPRLRSRRCESRALGTLVCAVTLCFAMLSATPAVAAAPAAGAPPPRSEQEVSGHRMAVSGTVLIIASAVGYIAMAVGLGIGNGADTRVRSLGSSAELDERRDVMDRGKMGNRLALGAGLSAAVLMGAGLGLTIAGRRRVAAARGLSLMPLRRGAGAQLSFRF